MSDVKLRSKLIRLAHAKPELRDTLLPLIKDAGAQKVARSLVLGPERIDNSATSGLRAMKNFPAKSRGDLDGAVKSAAYYAKKLNEKMFVYQGTSYGSGVWRVSSKKSEYLNPINNTGTKVAAVTPDLTVSWFDIVRPSSDKKASSDILDRLIPRNDMVSLYRKLAKEDKQSAELLRAVYSVLKEKLSLSGGEGEAFTRLSNTISQGQNWDSDLLRNNIFKAAHSLGMKLPSMMF